MNQETRNRGNSIFKNISMTANSVQTSPLRDNQRTSGAILKEKLVLLAYFQ